MRCILFTLCLAAFSTTSAPAQYVGTQDSSLRGLARLDVRFETPDGAVSPTLRSQLTDYLDLELRKAGLKLVVSDTALKESEGLLEVRFARSQGPSSDASLRLSLQQMATLKRTGQSLWMVSWFYEDSRRDVVPDSVAHAMIANGLNRFLNRWLAMNGR